MSIRKVTGSSNTLLYEKFAFAGQAGIPWKTSPLNPIVLYTDWQIVDYAPSVGLNIGDTIELEVIGAGCSQAAHWGYVYVDGFGASVQGLAVTKTAPATVLMGQNLTYSFTYQNGATVAADNVVVKETIPACATYVSNTNPSTGGTCTYTPGTPGFVTCNIGTLPPNTSGTFGVTVAANSDLQCASIQNGNYTIEGTGVSPTLGPLVSTTIQKPALSVTKTAPATVIAGQNLTYSFTYQNGPTVAADNVVVKETIPACATWVSNTDPSTGGTCTYTPGTPGFVTCNIGALPPNTSGTFAVTVAASANPQCASIQNGNYTIEGTGVSPTPGPLVSTTIQRPALSVTKTAPATVIAGQNLTYSFTYQNGPTVAADNVVVKETIPACATWVSNTDPSTGGTCTYTPGAPGFVTCNIGTLPPNTSGTFAVTVAASADPQCTSIDNANYTIEGTSVSPTPGPLVSTTIQEPALSVTKTAPATVIAGQNLTYSFTYQNGPTVAADNVVVKETIPACATWVSNTDPSTGGTCTYTPGAPGFVTCNIGTLPPNTSGTFAVTVAASADPQCTSIDNANYTIEGTGVSPTPGPLVSTTIQAPPALSITKTAPSTVEAGANLIYTFTYQNSGGSAADNVIVKETIAPCATYITNSNPSMCTYAGGVVTCGIGTLAANSSGTFTITVGVSTDPACAYILNSTYSIEAAGVPTQDGDDVLTIIPAPPIAPTSWFHDAFPHNADPSLPGTVGFDTTAALVKTGLNIAAPTNASARLDIPADSLIARLPGNNVRADLVFRIFPGPGNYVTTGIKSSGIARRPDDWPNKIGAVPGDVSFWGSYMGNNGAFGSSGGMPGNQWDANTWCSARMDTLEQNFFPCDGVQPNISTNPSGGLVVGSYMSCYHEADPKYAVLGIVKNRCFLNTNTPPVTIDDTQINCGEPKFSVYPPAWVYSTNPPSGYNPNEVSGQPGRTREYTKIIPDGQLTPGAHVEYFIRKSTIGDPLNFTMIPDTTFVTPQPLEGSTDAHRWQEFSVLPDRWKSASYGGPGLLCMLFVDLNDGHGDESAWVSAAELIGGTSAAKRGAHNGWKLAPGAMSPNNSPANFVSAHLGQPGTMWDMYGVRGIDDPLNGHAGSIGSRGATAGVGTIAAKTARIGPTLEMLKAYYGILYVLSGNSKDRLLGPLFTNRSQDDLGIIESWLLSSTSTNPRALFVEGDAFVQSLTGLTPAHETFLSTYLGIDHWKDDYSTWAPNPATCVTLTTPVAGGGPYGITKTTDPGGEDVFKVITGTGVAAGGYANVGGNGPYVSSVHKPAFVGSPWIALTDGWDLKRLMNPTCTSENGRLVYLYNVFTNVFASGECGGLAGKKPSAENSLTPEWLRIVSGTIGCFDVIVHDGLNIPIASAPVVVDFSGCTTALCPSQPPGMVVDVGAKTISTLTNSEGIAHFCVCASTPTAPCMATISADGVVLGTPPVEARGGGGGGADRCIMAGENSCMVELAVLGTVGRDQMLRLTLARPERIRVVVCDVAGRVVRRVLDGVQPVGRHQVDLKTRDLKSGVYFLQVKTSEAPIERRTLVVR